MRLFKRELSGIAETIVILAVILLCASGLCGLQTALHISPMDNGLWLILSILEFGAFWITAPTLAVCLIVWLVKLIIQRSQH